MAKVDIVIPCYNYGRFLDDCVGGVLRQSIQDVRVLIIDDASSDDSAAIAERLAKADPRVSFIAHPANRGHIDTYNEGIEWASSDYFLLLSADDLLVPGALERAVEVMDANPDVVLTIGDFCAWQDAHPAPIVPVIETYTWERYDLLSAICGSAINFVVAATAIIRTSTQKAVGGYRESLPHAGDMEMWLRLAANGSVAWIHAPQAIYRRHTTAMSISYSDEADRRQRELAFESFFKEYGGRQNVPHSLRDTFYHAVAYGVFLKGVKCVRRARFKEGARLMRQAMAADRRLRYLPPLWRVFKLPGPEGRDWAKSTLGTVANRLSKLKGSES